MLKSKKVVHGCLLFRDNRHRYSYIFKCQMNQLSPLHVNDKFGQNLTIFCDFAESPTEADPEGSMECSSRKV